MARDDSNPFKLAARGRKVLGLTAAIDRKYGEADDSVPTAAELRHWTPEMWEGLAREARINVPSEATIDAIIAHFELRESDDTDFGPFDRVAGDE